MPWVNPAVVMWDSGVVASAASFEIEYPATAGATALQPFHRYQWQVQWTSNTGQASPWSAPSFFETGLLTQVRNTQSLPTYQIHRSF